MRLIVILVCSAMGCASCGRVENPPDSEASSTRLKGVPEDLQFVLDNAGFFANEDNPLAHVTPGEHMGDLSELLSGCWGRIAPVTVVDIPVVEWDGTGEPPSSDVVVAEVYRIDLEAARAQQQRYLGVEGGPAIQGGLPGVGVCDIAIQSTSDEHLAMEIVDAEARLVTVEDLLSPDPWVELGIAITIGADVIEFFTVDGDWLASVRTGSEDAAIVPDEIRLWRRFDCVADGIVALSE